MLSCWIAKEDLAKTVVERYWEYSRSHGIWSEAGKVRGPGRLPLLGAM
jgi:hypothetical protein